MVSSVRSVSFSSVLSTLQQRFEMVDQCYSLVTAQSFILANKDSTPSSVRGRLTSRRGHNPSWLSLFYIHLSPPHPLSPHSLEACPMQTGLDRRGMFASPEAFTLVPTPGFSFVPFSWAFFSLFVF